MKDSALVMQNEQAVTLSGKTAVSMTIAVRPQTPEEERQFRAAMQLFLTELVRQQLDHKGEK